MTKPHLMTTPLPSAADAERAILGSVLLDNSLVWQARELLRAEWFHSEAHRLIFRAFVALSDARRAIDWIGLSDELGRAGVLEQIGGAVYLTSLVDGIPQLGRLDRYAAIVKGKAMLRALVRFGNDVQTDALADEDEPDDVLRRAQQRLVKISNAAAGAVDDTAAAVAEDFHADFTNPEAARGIHTGFPTLDRITGGLWPGNLWYLAAYTSTGKTAFATLIALNLAAAGHWVDFLSYEMPRKQILERLISSGWQIDLGRLRHARLTADEYARYSEAREWFKTAPLRIVDASGMTTADIRARANRLKAQGQLSAIVTDYIGLIPATGRHSSRAAEVAAISRELKQISTETEVPNLCLVQINREGAKADSEPQLWWLRDSGGQENDADVVAFLVREKDAATGALYVKKQRNGPLGDVPLVFEPAYARYGEGGY